MQHKYTHIGPSHSRHHHNHRARRAPTKMVIKIACVRMVQICCAYLRRLHGPIVATSAESIDVRACTLHGYITPFGHHTDDSVCIRYITPRSAISIYRSFISAHTRLSDIYYYIHLNVCTTTPRAHHTDTLAPTKLRARQRRQRSPQTRERAD